MITHIPGGKYINLHPVQRSIKRSVRWLVAVIAGHFLWIYLFAAGLALVTIYWNVARPPTVRVDSQAAATSRIFNFNADGLLTEIDHRLPDSEERSIPATAAFLVEKDVENDLIHIEEAFPVFIFDRDSITEIWTSPQPVREFLERAGFIIGPDDRVEPEGTVRSRAEIKIFRAESGDYSSRMQLGENYPGQPNPDRGSIRVYQRGLSEGPTGVGVGESGGETYFQEGLSGSGAIIPSGRPEYEAIRITGNEKRVSRVLEVTATAYCPGTPESGCPLNSQGHSMCTGCYNDGYTCTGKKAIQGEGTLESPHIIAVDPGVIPLGSKVYLEGIGFAIAEDVGGAIKGNRIDLLFNLHRDAWGFGLRKEIFLYILAETG